TCNYDGVHKHKTTIEDGVFVGSDTTLVAPIKVGKGAYIAAASCLTEDVPEDALALGRARQTNKQGWAKSRRTTMAAKNFNPAELGLRPKIAASEKAGPSLSPRMTNFVGDEHLRIETADALANTDCRSAFTKEGTDYKISVPRCLCGLFSYFDTAANR